jgi:YebC/PmpR family DNA-binding regulatory protein
MIQALTDNPTRTVADIRHKLSRNGGNMGTSGSVAYLFARKGQMSVDAEKWDEDAIMEAALEVGAEDVSRDEDVWVVSTEPAMLHAVREGLAAKRIETSDAAMNWVPMSTVRVEGADAQALVKLIDALEELDDVQKVEGNFDIDEAALADA